MKSPDGPGRHEPPGPLGVLAFLLGAVILLGVILWAYGAIP